MDLEVTDSSEGGCCLKHLG